MMLRNEVQVETKDANSSDNAIMKFEERQERSTKTPEARTRIPLSLARTAAELNTIP